MTMSHFKLHATKMQTMEFKYNEQSDFIMKIKTEQTKNEILSRLYSSGLEDDDREEFIKQVDHFLNNETTGMSSQVKEMLKSKEKLKKANFSGVTNNLDELYALMQTL